MVTLKDNRNRKEASALKETNKQIARQKTLGLLYFILLLPVLVYSSHVVLHAGFCDKILRAFVGRTPGDQSR